MLRRIKVCLNGGRPRGVHPALPVTSAEIAAAAVASVAAGAEAIHLHPRGEDGLESLRPQHIGPAVAAVRVACPAVPVGVSTGLWITAGDPDRRLALVQRWSELPALARPDFASINVGEPGFAEICDALHRAGIDVEAGVWSVADADALSATGRAGGVLRILVEVIGVAPERAVVTADEILARLDHHALAAPRLLHGEEATCWPLVSHAGRRRLPTRIGLEDTLAGPAGAAARDNADLVRLALTEWERAHHPRRS